MLHILNYPFLGICCVFFIYQFGRRKVVACQFGSFFCRIVVQVQLHSRPFSLDHFEVQLQLQLGFQIDVLLNNPKAKLNSGHDCFHNIENSSLIQLSISFSTLRYVKENCLRDNRSWFQLAPTHLCYSSIFLKYSHRIVNSSTLGQEHGMTLYVHPKLC